VGRLMNDLGLHGAVRGKKFRTGGRCLRTTPRAFPRGKWSALVGAGSPTTIATMRRTLKECLNDDSGCDPRKESWKRVRSWKADLESWSEDREAQEVAERATALRKNFGTWPDNNPLLFARAVEEAYSLAADELVEWRRGHWEEDQLCPRCDPVEGAEYAF
jgi:hypothetical protein